MFGTPLHTLWSSFIQWTWKFGTPLGKDWEITTTFDNTNLGMLGRLPQELRDIIYQDVIASGHTSILRTSKALYKDMKPVVSSHGLYRVQIIHGSYRNGRSRYALDRQFSIAPQVQNMEIHIQEGAGKRWQVERSGIVSKDLEPIFHAILNPVEVPSYCRLKIENPHGDRVNAEALGSFQLLGVFRTVDVQVGIFQFYLLSV